MKKIFSEIDDKKFDENDDVNMYHYSLDEVK